MTWKYTQEIASLQALQKRMLELYQRNDFAGAIAILGLLQRRVEEKIK